MLDNRLLNWIITDNNGSGLDVIPGDQIYRLLNRTEERKLRYGRRSVGANLKWGLREGLTNVRFERLAGPGRIRSGDSVAIWIGGGGYLHQAFQWFGIDLEFKSTPVYHWRIRNENGSDGSPIKTGEPVSIYSKTMDASLCRLGDVNYYFGINLGWCLEHPSPDPGDEDEPEGAPDERRRDWYITSDDPSGSTVTTEERTYRLLNRTQQRKLRYGKRRLGINLKWGLREGARNITFLRLEGDGPLRYGDSIAMHVNGGSYLRQGSQLWGIELTWSGSPVFHWVLRGPGGSDGALVKTDDPVAIYSQSMDASLVYGSRAIGINLVWLPEH